jgi:SHS family lactate transporter-like MFS transporter
MFLQGGAPALLAVYIHFRVKESEVWQQSRTANWASQRSAIFANWKLFFYLVLLMTFMNFCSHGTQDMYPTFLQRFWHFDASKRSAISMFAGVGAIIGGIAGGFFSDKVGRRRAIVVALIGGILVIPLWALAPTQALLISGAFLMQFMVQAAWGVVPAHLSELSPDSVRGFLPGFAYQCGTLFSSVLVSVQAKLAEHMSYSTTMAVTVATVFIGASIVAALGRERHGEGVWGSRMSLNRMIRARLRSHT